MVENKVQGRGWFEGHESHGFTQVDVEKLPLDLVGDAVEMLMEREEAWRTCSDKNHKSFKPIGNLLKWVRAKNHADRFNGGMTHGDFMVEHCADQQAHESLLDGVAGLIDEVEDLVMEKSRSESVSTYFERICDAVRYRYGEPGVEECQFLDRAIPSLKGKSTRRKQQVFQQILEQVAELHDEVGDQAHKLLKFVSKTGGSGVNTRLEPISAGQLELVGI